MSEPVRLNKRIAQMGLASRREADRLIAEGRVKVNGEVVREMGLKVDPERDTVAVDTGGLKPRTYVALHKPAGYVSLAKPLPDEPNVVTALVDIPGLFPVGRLDRDTTGLILLTDDGTLVTALNQPGAREKEYDVTLDRPVPDGVLAHLAAGVPMMGTRTRPAQVRRTGPNTFRLVLTEGRNRQVRRMCRKVGFSVTALKRVRIDCVGLQNLPEGRWRHLTPEEVRGLKGP